MEGEFARNFDGEEENDVGGGGADELFELANEVVVALVGGDYGEDMP